MTDKLAELFESMRRRRRAPGRAPADAWSRTSRASRSEAGAAAVDGACRLSPPVASTGQGREIPLLMTGIGTQHAAPMTIAPFF